MDGLTVTKITNILKSKLNECKLINFLLDDNIAQLHFYGNANFLNISFGTNNVAVYFSSKPLSSNKNIHYLENSIIKDITNILFERVIFIKLIKYKGSGKRLTFTLVLEMFTKYPNLFILDENDRIIFQLKNQFLDSSRNNFVGNKYTPVLMNKRHNLFTKEFSNFIDMQGFYTVTANYAEELAREMGVEAAKSFILASLQDDVFYMDEKERIIPFRINNYKETLNFNEFSKYVNARFNLTVVDEKKKKILLYLEKLKKENEKALEKVKSEYMEAKDYQKYIEKAELLKNNLPFITLKEGPIYLNQYTEKGVNIVKYDLKGADVKNFIEKLFNRGKKLKRGLPYLEKRLKELEKNINVIDKEMEEINRSDQIEEIDFYANFYFEHKGSKNKEVGTPFFKIKKGDVIYIIGKNKKSNDLIVSRLSRRNDMWFHVRGAPSSHVIARKNGDLTDEEINFGAKLAATFSRFKSEKKVTVDYTLKKYVNKPKKSPEGYVHYSNFKSIIVEPIHNFQYFEQ
jgi:predicted ribosome quality control (RQC) complex YloA/Tae2 family protein